MDLSLEKLNLIQQILLIKDEDFVKSISRFIEKKRGSVEEVDGWEELPEKVRESIEIAQKQMEEGQGIPLEDVLEKYRKKYQR
ncbi:MAG: hypothetical protein R2788_03340 [Saprospiraceae bacterium]